ESNAVDLVISDIMMEGDQDGLELCQQLKEQAHTAHIPVILLTAKGTHADRLQGLAHGADAYLSKPFDEPELWTRVSQLLQLRKKLRTSLKEQAILDWVQPQCLTPADQELMKRLHQVCLDHLGDRSFGVEAMARAIGKSRSGFHAWLVAQIHLTPAKFLLELRLRTAQQFLLHSKETIEFIADQTGFTDGTHLTKRFKAHFHQSPSEWRKQANRPS
ncbi:MAG: helix-turn-helix domain-containing protein, partial [Bacteroidota bacterium]